MTQKTAVMLMIEMIESVRRDEPTTALWNLKKYAQELLATEKEQIIKAHDDGYNEGLLETGIHGEQFYNKTYGNSVKKEICRCGKCSAEYQHKSDCAVHNEPAMINGECDCNLRSIEPLT